MKFRWQLYNRRISPPPTARSTATPWCGWWWPAGTPSCPSTTQPSHRYILVQSSRVQCLLYSFIHDKEYLFYNRAINILFIAATRVVLCADLTWLMSPEKLCWQDQDHGLGQLLAPGPGTVVPLQKPGPWRHLQYRVSGISYHRYKTKYRVALLYYLRVQGVL